VTNTISVVLRGRPVCTRASGIAIIMELGGPAGYRQPSGRNKCAVSRGETGACLQDGAAFRAAPENTSDSVHYDQVSGSLN